MRDEFDSMRTYQITDLSESNRGKSQNCLVSLNQKYQSFKKTPAGKLICSALEAGAEAAFYRFTDDVDKYIQNKSDTRENQRDE